MQRVLTFSLLLFSAFQVFGQKKKSPTPTAKASTSQCQLTKAPAFRGFLLGQSVEAIDKFVHGFKAAYDKEQKEGVGDINQTDYHGSWENRLTWQDVGAVQLRAYFDENSKLVVEDFSKNSETQLAFLEDLVGLHSLSWWFYEDKLYGFAIYYAEYAPKSIWDFISQLSEKTPLPQKGWIATSKDGTNKYYEAVLKCKGFKVTVNTGYRGTPHVLVTDTDVETEILSLEREIKLQRKKEEQERIRLDEKKWRTLKP